jgi:hypothetical protein
MKQQNNTSVKDKNSLVDKAIFDKFSVLHFSVGAILFYFNISLFTAIIIHTIHEMFENPTLYKVSKNIIDYFFKNINPELNKINLGVKNYRYNIETSINSFLGDTLSFVAGWCFASYYFYNGNK